MILTQPKKISDQIGLHVYMKYSNNIQNYAVGIEKLECNPLLKLYTALK